MLEGRSRKAWDYSWAMIEMARDPGYDPSILTYQTVSGRAIEFLNAWFFARRGWNAMHHAWYIHELVQAGIVRSDPILMD